MKSNGSIPINFHILGTTSYKWYLIFCVQGNCLLFSMGLANWNKVSQIINVIKFKTSHHIRYRVGLRCKLDNLHFKTSWYKKTDFSSTIISYIDWIHRFSFWVCLICFLVYRLSHHSYGNLAILTFYCIL